MNYLKRYPGDQDIVQRFLEMKRQAQMKGVVNPDYAPVVQGSLADERERRFKDAMLGLQEKGQTLAEQKQTAQENQFNQLLAQKGLQYNQGLDLQRQLTEDQISAANRAREKDWLNLALGTGLAGGYLLTNKRRVVT